MAELEVIPENSLDPNNQVAPDAPAQEQEDISEESSTEENQESLEEQPKKNRGVQKRLDELTANWRSAERRAERLEALLEKTLTKPSEPLPAQEPVKQATEPTVEQFKTYEEYIAAMADYKAEQKFREWETRQKQAEAQRAKAEQQTAFQKRAEEFRLAHPDFDEVVFSSGTAISEPMAEAIAISERGPQVAYYLGNNPEEARRLFDLSLRNPIAAAREIGLLEGKLSLPQPRTTTKAPPPIQPLSAGGGTLSPDPEQMTMDEWVKWRNASLRK